MSNNRKGMVKVSETEIDTGFKELTEEEKGLLRKFSVQLMIVESKIRLDPALSEKEKAHVLRYVSEFFNPSNKKIEFLKTKS